ncbi:MAG: hypothetical protein QOI20_1540 [Acidimicrobiaceae bacterium]|nr:hypothetical protein [Acidimicrobiaceae bacterium]
MAASKKPVAVYLEVGAKKTFACTLDWPGWCRAGKGEDDALEALAAYAERYRGVAKTAGLDFPYQPDTVQFDVVERVPGSATTDFGAPGEVPKADAARLTPTQATRLASLVDAAWKTLDRVAKTAPAELRKGPRGGGRDRDKMLDHVNDAEVAYARKLGIKNVAHPALRKEIAKVLAAARAAEPESDKGWPPRYAARRIAWHVLDHAWEMQDRSTP